MARLTAHQIERGDYAVEINLQTTTCPNCHITFAAPKRMLEDARADHRISVYCPAGHSLHWPGLTIEEKLAQARAEADRERARADHNEARRKAQKAATTKARKRHAGGVCPACKRSFKQLRDHMERMHPGFDPATDTAH